MKRCVIVGSTPDWDSEVSFVILPTGKFHDISMPQCLHLSSKDNNSICGGLNGKNLSREHSF